MNTHLFLGRQFSTAEQRLIAHVQFNGERPKDQQPEMQVVSNVEQPGRPLLNKRGRVDQRSLHEHAQKNVAVSQKQVEQEKYWAKVRMVNDINAYFKNMVGRGTDPKAVTANINKMLTAQKSFLRAPMVNGALAIIDLTEQQQPTAAAPNATPGTPGYMQQPDIDGGVPGLEHVFSGAHEQMPDGNVNLNSLPPELRDSIRTMPPELVRGAERLYTEFSPMTPEKVAMASGVIRGLMQLDPTTRAKFVEFAPAVIDNVDAFKDQLGPQYNSVKTFVDSIPDPFQKQYLKRAVEYVKNPPPTPSGRMEGGSLNNNDTRRMAKIDKYVQEWKNAKSKEEGMIAEGMLRAMGVDVDASDLAADPPKIQLIDLKNESKEDRAIRQLIAGLQILYGLFAKYMKKTTPLSDEEMKSRGAKSPDSRLAGKKQEIKDKEGQLKEVEDRLTNVDEKLKDPKTKDSDRPQLQKDKAELEKQRDKLKDEIKKAKEEEKKLQEEARNKPLTGTSPNKEVQVKSGMEHTAQNTKDLRTKTEDAQEKLKTARQSRKNLVEAYQECISVAQKEWMYLQEFPQPDDSTRDRIGDLARNLREYHAGKVIAQGEEYKHASESADKALLQAKTEEEKTSARKDIVESYDKELAHLHVHATSSTDNDRITFLTTGLLHAKKELADSNPPTPDALAKEEKDLAKNTDDAKAALEAAKNQGNRNNAVSAYEKYIDACHKELMHYAAYKKIETSDSRANKIMNLGIEITTKRREKIEYLTKYLQEDSEKAQKEVDLNAPDKNLKQQLHLAIKTQQEELEHLQTYDPQSTRTTTLELNLHTRRRQLAAVEAKKAVPDATSGHSLTLS